MEDPLPELLWKPANPESTRIFDFKKSLESKYGVQLKSYQELYQWSISNINPFWEEVWHFTGVKASRAFTKVSLIRLDPANLC